MEHSIPESFDKSQHILDVMDQIVKMCSPRRIYLYNQKVGLEGETTSFKLCLVAGEPGNRLLEKEINIKVDCEVPFDVLVYSPEEWEELTAQPDSFAAKIARTGLLLHG